MSVRVAVRVRPFNGREKALGSTSIVSMHEQTTILHNPHDGTAVPRQFSFDHSFWSHDPADNHFSNQEQVYDAIGKRVLEDAFEGYHSTVFAYGQTGSGKSYTMMGAETGDGPGLIPRLCENLFAQISGNTDDNWSAHVEVSYMEIYLERVRDLLNPASTKYLRVREHASTGPYVEDLTSLAVVSFDKIQALMDAGNKMRTVRATSMNDVSSRSHAIFQLIFTQTKVTSDGTNVCKMERVSKISLVDLAGSERSGQINAKSSSRMKEGNVINQSLSTLGKVMTTLADRSSGKTRGLHIPYRESVLTWLLRESLGGNAKTFMVAAISPASDNFDETLSTLRYANQAKKIINSAVVNEDATATMLRQLNDEINQLRQQLASAEKQSRDSEETIEVSEVLQRLLESEKLVETLNETWEEKLIKTRELQDTRMEKLRDHGILLADDDEDDDVPLGVMAPQSTPFLLNLNPMSTRCLVYYLREGTTAVGSGYDNFSDESHSDTESPTAVSAEGSHEPRCSTRVITLQARDIMPHHCDFVSTCTQDFYAVPVPVVVLRPRPGARLLCNNVLISIATRLVTGDRITIGDVMFCFTNPEEVRYAPSMDSKVFAEHFSGDGTATSGEAGQVLDFPVTTQPSTGQSQSETRLASQDSAASVFIELPSPCSSSDEESPETEGGEQLEEGERGPYTDQGDRHEGPRDTHRLSPLGSAGENELGEAGTAFNALRLAAIRQKASFFEYDLCKEYPLLVHFTTQAYQSHFEYPLAPAFALYMMTSYRQSISGPEELSAFLDKLVALVRYATIQAHKRRDISCLASWLANASELLMALRHDESFVASSGAAQLCLSEVVQEAFSALVNETNARLKLAVPAMLKAQGIFTLHSQGRERASSDPEDGVQYAVESLDALCTLLHETQVDESLIQACFSSIFYYLGAVLFNEFIGSQDQGMYQWDRGLIIRFNIQLLSDWSAGRRLVMHDYFAHIIQASQLLQTNKSSLEHLDAICQTCTRLNSLQLGRILEHYSCQPDEKKMPATLVDCLRARAMANADHAVLEDETVNCSLQLFRNPNFLLPFRLTAASYKFEERLSQDDVLENMSAYMSYMDVRSQADDPLTVVDDDEEKPLPPSPVTAVIPGALKLSDAPSKKSFFQKYFSGSRRTSNDDEKMVSSEASSMVSGDFDEERPRKWMTMTPENASSPMTATEWTRRTACSRDGSRADRSSTMIGDG